jgi:hypothetical protein
MPQQNLATFVLERAKIERQRVVYPPRPNEGRGFAVEIELKRVYNGSRLLVDKIPLELAG